MPTADPAARPAAEVDVDEALVRRLLAAEHPDLAGLALTWLGSGWDNEVYRLGADLAVRVPRRALGAALVGTELRWLPSISPRLPLPTPEPVRAGRPACGYPFPWMVCRYVPGRPVGAGPLTGAPAADALAAFLRALHVPAPDGAPRSRFRGLPLAHRSTALERALPVLPWRQREAARALWRRAVGMRGHHGPTVWLHGDLHGLNILVQGEAISGVIDFGDLCAGDPATDLACAWLVLDGPGRDRLRERLAPDDAQWERGRAWGLYLSVMLLAHGADSEVGQRIGRRGVSEVLDQAAGS